MCTYRVALKVLDFDSQTLCLDLIPASPEEQFLTKFLRGTNSRYPDFESFEAAEYDWIKPLIEKPTDDVHQPMFGRTTRPGLTRDYDNGYEGWPD